MLTLDATIDLGLRFIGGTGLSQNPERLIVKTFGALHLGLGQSCRVAFHHQHLLISFLAGDIAFILLEGQMFLAFLAKEKVLAIHLLGEHQGFAFGAEHVNARKLELPINTIA
jgi:hypothetical protein